MSEAIPSWAVRGAKVVALATATPRLAGEIGVVKGSVYTIREVFLSDTDRPCLRFTEITNPIKTYCGGASEAGFWVGKFRPLVTRSKEQDVSHFVHHLNRVGVDA